MRASEYVGRVGGLAIALGIGVATSGLGAAWASPGDSSDSSAGADSSVSTGSVDTGPAARSRGGRASRPATADVAGDSSAPRDSRGAVMARPVDLADPRKNTVPAPVSAPGARPSSPMPVAPSPHSGANDRASLPAMNTGTSYTGPAVTQPATQMAAADPLPATDAVSVHADVPQMVVSPARPAAAGTVDSVWSPLLGANPGAPVESAVSWVMLAAARRELGGARTAPATAAAVTTGQVVATAASTVTVTPPNTAPTAVNDGPFTVTKGGSLTLTYAQLVGNDTDPDKATGDTLAVNSVSTATGTVTHNPTTKTVTYTPPPTYTGPAAFIYRTKDSTGTTSANTATVAITVNTAPVAGTTTVGTPNTSTGVVNGSVTATDANGDTLTYRISTNPTKGTAVVATNGTFTYTPTATARYLATQTGAPTSDLTDAFTVTVTDGYGGSATIPVNVAVAAYSGNATVGFSTAFQRVAEGDSGTTSAPLSVQLSTASATTVTVDYTIRPSGGTDQATAGVDFVAATGTLTFAPGQTEATLPVTIYGDTAYEGSEIITVELSNPTGAILVAYGAEGSRSDSTYLLIDNNDAPRSTAVASAVAATLL